MVKTLVKKIVKRGFLQTALQGQEILDSEVKFKGYEELEINMLLPSVASPVRAARVVPRHTIFHMLGPSIGETGPPSLATAMLVSLSHA